MLWWWDSISVPEVLDNASSILTATTTAATTTTTTTTNIVVLQRRFPYICPVFAAHAGGGPPLQVGK